MIQGAARQPLAVRAERGNARASRGSDKDAEQLARPGVEEGHVVPARDGE